MTIFRKASRGGVGLGTLIFMPSSTLRIKAGKKIQEYKINALNFFCLTKGIISI